MKHKKSTCKCPLHKHIEPVWNEVADLLEKRDDRELKARFDGMMEWIICELESGDIAKSELAGKCKDEVEYCDWTWNEGFWSTDCGKAWYFEHGDPKENEIKYCMFCGKNLRQIDFEKED